MPLLDPKDPFFARLWVRWATAGLPLAWGLFELFTGNPGWAVLFLAAGAYAAWALILPGR